MKNWTKLDKIEKMDKIENWTKSKHWTKLKNWTNGEQTIDARASTKEKVLEFKN